MCNPKKFIETKPISCKKEEKLNIINGQNVR